MKTNYLFPNRFKKIGLFLFIPGIILTILAIAFDMDELNIFNTHVFSIASQPIMSKPEYFSIIEDNIQNEITGLLLIIGALFIAFSKEKYEDEFIAKIRLESLVWATYINYAVLIITLIFVYEMMFFWVLVLNMFTLLIFFICRFNWALYKSKNQIKDEE